MRSFSQDILRLLSDYGVQHVFGIPGVHNVELYRGFGDVPITQITPRHEQGAGFMAYGYAIATGKPGVCFVITGPGLTNIATAMGEAFSDSVPMLVLATNNELTHIGLGSGRLHETISQKQIADQLCGYSHQILDQRNFPEVLGQAFSSFCASRPRPAYIEIPLNILAQKSEIVAQTWPAARRPGPDREAVKEATALLLRAKRPIILAGGGAVDAAASIGALSKALGAAIVTTTSGKGIVSEDDPLSLGATLPFRPVQECLKNSDAVLAVGTELSETDTLYTYTRYAMSPNLIRVDIEPSQVIRNYKPLIPITSDAGLAIDAILECVSGHGVDRQPQVDFVRSIRSQLTGEWVPGADGHKKILDVMRDVLKDDAILAAEECQLGYTACHYFKSRKPRTFIYPSGFGTLGPALPAAIGAKVGLPGRQVAVIAGDGSFLFSVGELAAAAELKLSIPVIIWNNRGYGEIAYDMDRKKIQRVGVDLATPNFQAVAMGFGCHSGKPENFETFRGLFVQGLTAPAPTIIELDAAAPFLN